MASPSATQATRRRQRSIRVTAAVGLIVLAALVVAGAAVTGSWLLTTIAAGLGVLLGAAATRITHTELVESRVSAARDRATQAQAYNVLSDQRSAEHAAYVDEVRARLSDREQALDELEQALSEAQRRAATSTRKRNAEGRRAADLQVRLVEAEERAAISQLRVAELEQEVLALRAELDTVTTAWHAAEHLRKHA
jgi:chromosome segregation ATPase